MLRLFIFLCLFNADAWAQKTLELTFPDSPRPVQNSFYEITGENRTDAPQIVVIRMDDKQAPTYKDRVNEERWVLPGPFQLIIQPSALQTPSERFLTLNALKKITIFSPANISFNTIQPKWNKQNMGELAFDFGSPTSPIFPGFKLITPMSPEIISGNPKAFIRKGADSLIRDGINSITAFETPLANGKWNLHIWTENIGEWETLPPLLERRIRINGQNASLIRRDHETWVPQRYLEGKNYETEDTPWKAFGQRRGGLFSTEIIITNKKLRLDFAGSNLQATTITALLIEPVKTDHNFNAIQGLRQEWFDARWPYVEVQPTKTKQIQSIISFAGETLFVDIDLKKAPSHPLIRTKLRFAPFTFQRASANSGLLVRSHRRFGTSALLNGKTILEIHIPKSVKPARYKLGELDITVVTPALPKLGKSIGIYLEAPPHLIDQRKIDMQVWCDLDYLIQLGLSAIAPPFTRNVSKSFKRAQSFGFRDILAYTPMKNYSREILSQEIRKMRTSQPIWSIADEPSNPGQAQVIKHFSDFLQNESPFAKRAGHLNNPRDRKHLNDLDITLVNSGYGVDKTDIDFLRSKNKSPWFYNMENIRLAAGFYIWKAKADGYLQWHGRMPTADPYDPTDGREDDVQMLYPNATVCSQDYEIDRNLMDMVNGLSDLRWLNWLDQQAKHHMQAVIMKKYISKHTPSQWNDARRLPHRHWDELKQQIQKLALTLQR